jgi:hypothetical protein
MDIKPRPNHQLYLQTLRRMTPEQRLKKAFELADLGKRLFLAGLKRRFPDYTPEELHRVYLERIALCHNRNY